MKALIARATEGTLLQSELDEVVKCLEGGTCDPYEALLIIGRSGAIQYRHLVEKYLRMQDSPMLARLALMILCRYWKLTTDYKSDLISFVRKVEWDSEDDIRVLAISIAGSLLAEQQDDVVLRLIIDVFRDRTDSEPQIVREVAYCALAEAAGQKPNELPAASRHFDLERDVDASVMTFIDSAERRLAALKGKRL